MPSIFKALATTVVWFLFVLGIILVVFDGILLPIIGQITMIEAYFASGLGIACLILSVVAMKLRKTLQ